MQPFSLNQIPRIEFLELSDLRGSWESLPRRAALTASDPMTAERRHNSAALFFSGLKLVRSDQ